MHLVTDASWDYPHSQTGWSLWLRGPRGSCYLLDWGSTRQRVTATSSGEAETLALFAGTKAAQVCQTVLEDLGMPAHRAAAHCDNAALILAVQRGYSQRMAHMRKHVGCSFRYLHDALHCIDYVPTKHNFADVFTKGLSEAACKWLCREIFGLTAEDGLIEPDKQWPLPPATQADVDELFRPGQPRRGANREEETKTPPPAKTRSALVLSAPPGEGGNKKPKRDKRNTGKPKTPALPKPNPIALFLDNCAQRSITNQKSRPPKR